MNYASSLKFEGISIPVIGSSTPRGITFSFQQRRMAGMWLPKQRMAGMRLPKQRMAVMRLPKQWNAVVGCDDFSSLWPVADHQEGGDQVLGK